MRTLSQTLKEFLSKNLDLKWNTLRSYDTAAGNLIKAIGDKSIKTIDQNDIEDFRVWLYGMGRKPGSIDSTMKNARPEKK